MNIVELVWDKDDAALRRQETVTAGGQSDAVRVKIEGADEACATLTPGVGGSGVVLYTLSSVADIIADQALWVPWPQGSVTAPAGSTIPRAATAIMATALTADAELIVSQR